MSDIKLFRFSKEAAQELAGRAALVERDLHDLMEKHLECFQTDDKARFAGFAPRAAAEPLGGKAQKSVA